MDTLQDVYVHYILYMLHTVYITYCMRTYITLCIRTYVCYMLYTLHTVYHVHTLHTTHIRMLIRKGSCRVLIIRISVMQVEWYHEGHQIIYQLQDRFREAHVMCASSLARRWTLMKDMLLVQAMSSKTDPGSAFTLRNLQASCTNRIDVLIHHGLPVGA